LALLLLLLLLLLINVSILGTRSKPLKEYAASRC